jgi:hypothetical protein
MLYYVVKAKGTTSRGEAQDGRVEKANAGGILVDPHRVGPLKNQEEGRRWELKESGGFC